VSLKLHKAFDNKHNGLERDKLKRFLLDWFFIIFYNENEIKLLNHYKLAQQAKEKSLETSRSSNRKEGARKLPFLLQLIKIINIKQDNIKQPYLHV
jgi:hypothetical protein